MSNDMFYSLGWRIITIQQEAREYEKNIVELNLYFALMSICLCCKPIVLNGLKLQWRLWCHDSSDGRTEGYLIGCKPVHMSKMSNVCSIVCYKVICVFYGYNFNGYYMI